MALYIYHGPPGSYKTSSAVKDFLIKWILEGRPVITNVRGINIDKIWEIYGNGKERPKEQYFLKLDTVDAVSIFLLRYFFLWAPLGCALLIDEAQIIFPKGIVDKSFQISNFNAKNFKKELNEFDTESGLIKEILEKHFWIGFEENLSKEEILKKRPKSLADAFDMHRHFGYDIVFTMPSILSLNEKIRQCCEKAQLHKNLATQNPFVKKTFNTYTHGGLQNGPDKFTFKNTQKIDERIFGIYDSVVAGEARDTIARASLRDVKKLLFLSAIAVGILLFMLYNLFFKPGEKTALDFHCNIPIFGCEVSNNAEEVNKSNTESIMASSTEALTKNTSENNTISSNSVRNTMESRETGNSDIRNIEEKFNFFKVNTGGKTPFDGKRIIVKGCLIIAGKIKDCVMMIQDLDNDYKEKIEYKAFFAMGFRLFQWSRCWYDVRYNDKRASIANCYESKKEKSKAETLFKIN